MKNLTFEEATAKLETIIKALQSGEVELEKAIELYKEGAQLKEYCQKKLDEAKLKIEEIVHQGNHEQSN